jgi:hypothetical protein
MLTTAGPARRTASANERRGSPDAPGAAAALLEAAVALFLIALEAISPGRISSTTPAHARPTTVQRSRKTAV